MSNVCAHKNKSMNIKAPWNTKPVISSAGEPNFMLLLIMDYRTITLF